MLKKIQAQIDAGRPVLAGGVSHQGCGNWSLVIGYNKGNTELCHNGLDGEPAGTWSRIRGLAEPGNDTDGVSGEWNGRPRGSVIPHMIQTFHGGWLANPVFVLGDKQDSPDRRDVARTVLQRAAALHKAVSVPCPGGQYYFGVAAYQEWIAALPTLKDPNDLILDELVRGRSAAAAFCEQTAKLIPAASTPLRLASNAYRHEVETAQVAFSDFIPFRWDNPKREGWGSVDQCQAAGRALAEMLEHEHAAVVAIEEALKAWE